ncbi:MULTISPECIES: transcription-repair coupling factor [unclassified Shewanella]|uniref:transcription-repair coupling factor n=1 Tax=unclassified Shewanella TaxID=196818 RepID=UPI000C83D3A1|nr:MULTISPECIES: transcription-repair coupling factor [unclassified Shewanella]MDO6677934.1 transcription-repair coupling factor [Shewanella sp. 4_MG-2023]PMG27117.1 transcription-repair coupling factor [Shewanella sp. 10N.286.52.C2]PMG41930.1 transcription-repair coupling factor [Shewanella sp. 10N.286.52.B9]PMH88117.1 transcription-repair coupling factor [Shewanella sp. 10N.286.48.B5]PMI01960.1 transcription-repair coupling factor [Shewanella sp. 10N.286.48.A6]
MKNFSVLTPPSVKKGQQFQTLTTLGGVSQAITLSSLISQHSGTSLVVTNDTPSALQLEVELGYLLAESDINVCLFPDRETLPYDSFSPHQDLISQRLETLAKMSQSHHNVIIVPVNTLMVKLPPKSFLTSNVMLLKKGDIYGLQQVRQHLTDTGYYLVDQVYEHGEFAIRGSILDIFPTGSSQPLRIELFDDEVETIRYFDVDSQRSKEEIDSIRMLPAKEFPTDTAGIEGFRQRYRRRFEVISKEAESVYQQVSRNLMPAGIENYLPLFFEECATLFDYIPQDTQLITLGDIEQASEHHLTEIKTRYEDRRVDPLRPLLAPQELYILTDELFAAFKKYTRSQISTPNKNAEGELELIVKAKQANVARLPDVNANHKLKQPLINLQAYTKAQGQTKGQLLFSAESEGRREALIELLGKIDIKPKLFSHLNAFITAKDNIGLIVSPLSQGCMLLDTPKGDISVICETELFGQRISQRRRREKQKQVSSDVLVKNLAELKVGEPIVHLEHGVALYQGLVTLDTGGLVAEYLQLEYTAGDKLYVPVSSLHLISRYSIGADEKPTLNKLGNETWSKAKKKAIEKIRDVAAELLDVYARRQARPGDALKIDAEEYAQFSQGFPFEETVDQETAIEAVLSDMQTPMAMDRLVCGDVGFGKTEVAMRAAFVAVNAGKQVVVLVPTTLLAQQHYENFKDRFADWPMVIEVMSRFRSAKEQTQVLQSLSDGKVDIVIGTHKLLQAEANFENLGLLVIDEEHRFGVRQKEKIKALRANVDILTLTATPIPRTLNMAMSGMRDLSIIATPPAKRLAVKTFVREYDIATVREAILREILRGGQVYFLHNNVETIEKCAENIRQLLPEARVVTAHGQMRERELEKVMSEFYHQRFNVLVCTTIIETGIDVPSANTIIIDRADKFGLAQLHQLRGRVGRSHHQAYAYLMTPHPKLMSADARKRLTAIDALEDLGAGFMLATQDLEIRGAGELLGDEQSGHISKIGFSLYMEMLESAVKALKEGKEPSLDYMLKSQCEVELRIPALLPDDYVSDVNMRLSLYKRIANCETERMLDELKVEFIDRFGMLPEPTKNLMELTLYKHQATALGATKIEMHAKGGSIEFSDDHKIDPMFIIGLLQSQPQIYRMEGPNKLKFTLPAETSKQRLDLIKTLLEQLDKHRTGETK